MIQIMEPNQKALIENDDLFFHMILLYDSENMAKKIHKFLKLEIEEKVWKEIRNEKNDTAKEKFVPAFKNN